MKHFATILFLLSLTLVKSQSDLNPDFINENVKFFNSEIELSGQLYIPKGKGPFPTVIFTHGSGDSGIDNKRYRLEAEFFASHGILSMVYDKRGYMASKGNWRQATYEDLAKDAVAAMKLLKSRQEVDRSRIGLRGISQSGWILPIVAKMTEEVNFLILISPPGVTTYEQIVYDVRTDIEDLDYGPDDVEKAIEIIKSGLTYAESLTNWNRHQKVLDKYADQTWLEVAAGPPVSNHWLWSWVRPILHFDAVPLLEETEASVLVILGENDRVIPSQIAGYRFEKTLRKRNATYKIVYFPNAGHDLRSTTINNGTEEPPLVEGYLKTMKDWIIDAN